MGQIFGIYRVKLCGPNTACLIYCLRWLSQAAEEKYFQLVRVAQLSLRSEVLLQPFGVPPMPTPAMLHTKKSL